MQAYKQKSNFSASKNKMQIKKLPLKQIQFSSYEINPLKRKLVVCTYNLEQDIAEVKTCISCNGFHTAPLLFYNKYKSNC